MEGRKTLDEVISVLDECFGDDRYNIVPLECDPDYGKEALHYLKEYKNTDENYKQAIVHVTAVIDYYEKMIADYLADNNPALTWEELMQMERKPVWIEADNGQEQFKHWFIIEEFTMSDIPGLQIMWSLQQSYRFWEKDLGVTWKAYKKEIK